MIGRIGRARDPFEGRAARRRHLRVQIESLLALAMAIVACGLIAAVWVQALAPVFRALGLG